MSCCLNSNNVFLYYLCMTQITQQKDSAIAESSVGVLGIYRVLKMFLFLTYTHVFVSSARQQWGQQILHKVTVCVCVYVCTWRVRALLSFRVFRILYTD